MRPGCAVTLPGQWAGLPAGNGRLQREAVAVQVAGVEVQRRPLSAYEAILEGVSGS